MLGAAGVQIPEDNLIRLMETVDLLSGNFSFRVPSILSFFVLPEGCDPLALVDGFTPVEDNIAAKLQIIGVGYKGIILLEYDRLAQYKNAASSELCLI
ncbi:hypothetical protein Tco_1219376 [Tanacetum coccineum]|uniref:Uncharacterized protein n=1 Tax=Tanacetum coccineum TaxID=301880 RepID=A0ABQ5CKA7_9ASTR